MEHNSRTGGHGTLITAVIGILSILAAVYMNNSFNIWHVTITFDRTSYQFTGEEITPSFTVTLNDTHLQEGTDYIIYRIFNNRSVGNCKLIIKGIGNFHGYKTASFEIVKSSPEDCPFEDVAGTSPHYSAIMWAYENGLLSGTGKTTFSPDEPMTRGDFIRVLYQFAGSPSVKKLKEPFRDVVWFHAFSKAVKWAYNEGIVKNVENRNKFYPDSSITRGQCILMLYRMAGSPAADDLLIPFLDISPEVSGRALYAAIRWAYSNRITNGFFGANQFMAERECTRSQIAYYLYRFSLAMEQ